MIELRDWPTPDSHKITLFLEEARLDSTINPVNIGVYEQFEPELPTFSPKNRMPATTDHDPVDYDEPVTVSESCTILPCLAEKIDRFLLCGVSDRPAANRPFLAGDNHTIADTAAHPWIVPWKQRHQNLDGFVHFRLWLESIATGPETRRADGNEAPFSAQHTGTEECKRLFFGQTMASAAGT